MDDLRILELFQNGGEDLLGLRLHLSNTKFPTSILVKGDYQSASSILANYLKEDGDAFPALQPRARLLFYSLVKPRITNIYLIGIQDLRDIVVVSHCKKHKSQSFF